jgi:1-deoxy-D-xylulose-5-phosphate reductoisomerase
MRKKVSILGSTGSIGQSTLKVISHLDSDFEVVALAAKSNIDLLEKQIQQFSPKIVAVFDSDAAKALKLKVPHIPILSGLEGLCEVARFEGAEFVMLAMSGNLGLKPAISAIESRKTVGLANKEVLVSAGQLVSELVKKNKIPLIPVDSEHSAIFQCLKNENIKQVRRLILTASGGPFLHKTKKQLLDVSVYDAMQHPNFKMGPKITVDSSTMMNKGLEMIEARWLFDVCPSKIEAVVHPEQKVHSFVEFIDGSMLAQICEPDMVVPIQYALSYPTRKNGLLHPFDFKKCSLWSFFEPDLDKFLCLKLAIYALKEGKSYPCFLNAANEVLVDRFLKQEITWQEIGEKLEKLISSHNGQNLLTLESILEVDQLARQQAEAI